MHRTTSALTLLVGLALSGALAWSPSASGAAGEAGGGRAPAARTAPLAGLTLDGDLDYDLWVYLRDSDPSGAHALRNQVRVEPRLKARAGIVAAVLQAQARVDAADAERNRVLLKDAYAQVRLGALKIRAGNQVLRWGRMDMRPALDLLTPRDYDELWDPERLAAPALLATVGMPSWSVSAAWLPTFQPSLYPVDERHRWNVLAPQPQVALADALRFPITYDEVRDPVVTVGDTEAYRVFDSQVGLRAEVYLARLDLGLQGYLGRDTLPTYHLVEGLNGDVVDPTVADLTTFQNEGVHVALTPVYARKGVVGGDAALVLGPVVLKGEVAYTITEDPRRERCEIPDPYLQGTVGLEWIANNLVGGQDLQLRLEVAGDHELPVSDDGVINRDDHCDDLETETPIVDVNHLSVMSFYGNIQWYFTDDVVLDLRGFVGVEGDYLARVELYTVVRSHLRIGLAGLIVGGRDGSFMDHYDRNDRVELSTAYLF